MPDQSIEQTLVLIKPDAMKNSLTGYILSQLSEFHTGLRFSAMKVVKVSSMLAGEHYAEHKGKGFYPSLLEYIAGELHYPANPERRRVIALIYQGPNAVKAVRDICGPTNPHVAREEKPGCIRSLGTIVNIKDAAGNIIGDRMDNLIHASANLPDSERETKLWFTPSDFPPSMRRYAIELHNADVTYYCTADGKLSTKFAEGCRAVIAPGQLAWASDLAALRLLAEGKDSAISLESVAAKYLINID